MIEIFGALGLVAFAASSVTIGVRCLVRGLANGEIPELAVGAGFLVGVLLGYVPESLATSTDLLAAEQAGAVLAVTQVTIRLSVLAVMTFTLSVFGRGPLRMALFAILSIALGASWIAFPHYASEAASAADRAWYEVFSATRATAVAWGAVESLAYARKAGRRRFGLADPVVTNRFGLWGLGLLALTGLMASTTLAGLCGVDPTSYAWVLLESSLGMVGAVALWLAFFPTRSYLARFARSA